jgi:hypothetical protein
VELERRLSAPLEVTRGQVLGHRRRAGSLDARLPAGRASLERAAWAGLQDSMPRAALLSIHARVEGAHPAIWADPALVQLWGPRFSVYVVPERDRALFSLGRLPEDGARRAFAEDLAARLGQLLEGSARFDSEIGRALGVHTNALRYAAPTGTVLIRWDGARAPTMWTVPRPDVDPRDARNELARRHLHVFGPTTARAFGDWAGIRPPAARAAYDALASELAAVRTPIGDAWILAADEPSFRAGPSPAAAARLLPSGDAYTLLKGDDRSMLVPEAPNRERLWTPRVWPGALLVGGEIVGTWRRDQGRVSIETWRPLSAHERQAVEAEAAGLPLPNLAGKISVAWAAN